VIEKGDAPVTVEIEARGGTVVPPPPRDTAEQQIAYLQQYMPIKFGSALFAKMKKRYWERPHVAANPFVLAIADFSSPGSMMTTSSALERYLFGYEHAGEKDADGKLRIVPTRVEQHAFGEKVIPSGFFRTKDSENVSAVVSTTAGTISKFNRMGVLAGFGTGRVVPVREGTLPDSDPNATQPLRFRSLINAPGYDERWVDGLNVYHNPNAAMPLERDILPGAAHHFCDAEGQVTSELPAFHPFASITHHLAPVEVSTFVENWGDHTHLIWSDGQWIDSRDFRQARATSGG
jgi:hypothetical protein